MVYNRNIPGPNDILSNSQSQLQANFQQIDSGTTGSGTGFSRNHVTLTDGTNGGLHNRVDFYQPVADPSISGFTGSLYVKTVGGLSQLFFANSSLVTQLTGITGAAGSGTVTIPGGIVLKWGTVSVPAGFTNTITFPVAFPANCYAVVVSINTTTVSPSADTLTVQASNFTVNNFLLTKSSTSKILSICYVALGN